METINTSKTGMNIMPQRTFEILLGAIVLFITFFFLYVAFTKTAAERVSGYHLTANFDQANGIQVGSDVRLNGVYIGKVIDKSINPETYQAVLNFSVRDDIKLPTDTIAQIATEGLMGGKYLEITPGGDEEVIKPGGNISITQPSVDLVELLGKVMFNSSKQNGTDKQTRDAQ